MSLLAALVEGETDWADVFYVVAIIVALVAAFLYNQAKALPSVLEMIAIAFIAAGLLML